MSVSILPVDDEPGVAELFRQRFRRIRPAWVAVLSDVNMPGMDGLELLAERNQRCPDLPAMMVIAYGGDER